MDQTGAGSVGRPRLAAAVLLALVALTGGIGCGDDDSDGGGGAPTVAATPPERAFSDFEELDAGKKYETAAFDPAMRFQLPPGAWTSETGDTPEHFALAAIEPPAGVSQAIVGVHRINSVFAPERGGTKPGDVVPFDGKFIDWLREHPHLRTSTPKSVTLMELPGKQVDITTKSSSPTVPDECGKFGGKNCVPLFYDGLDEVLYAATTRGRFTVLSLPDDGELVIEQFVQPAKAFKDGLAVLSPLVKRLQLASG